VTLSILQIARHKACAVGFSASVDGFPPDHEQAGSCIPRTDCRRRGREVGLGETARGGMPTLPRVPRNPFDRHRGGGHPPTPATTVRTGPYTAVA
jgi:hypothetical protein